MIRDDCDSKGCERSTSSRHSARKGYRPTNFYDHSNKGGIGNNLSDQRFALILLLDSLRYLLQPIKWDVV